MYDRAAKAEGIPGVLLGKWERTEKRRSVGRERKRRDRSCFRSSEIEHSEKIKTFQ